jgi:hypothetical protein
LVDYFWFGLVWLGLAWFGLVWLGLAWFGCDWNQIFEYCNIKGDEVEDSTKPLNYI